MGRDESAQIIFFLFYINNRTPYFAIRINHDRRQYYRMVCRSNVIDNRWYWFHGQSVIGEITTMLPRFETNIRPLQVKERIFTGCQNRRNDKITRTSFYNKILK